ncbi:hypothetical protein Q5752_005514 [Cryptotrichosporon argae]
MDQDERDARLAQLLSVLEPAVVEGAACVAALERTAWDVAAAAGELLEPAQAGAGPAGAGAGSRSGARGKRKAATGLDGWLRKRTDGDGARPDQVAKAQSQTSNEKHTSALEQDRTAPKRDTSLPEPETQPPKREPRPTFDLSTLRPPPPPAPKSLPALTLTSSSALAAHRVPLALLDSPLPPAFAAALYLAMMAESDAWETNKFYLAGRKVESGHTMASYARPEVADHDGNGESESGGEMGKDRLLDGPGVRFYYSGNKHAVKPYPPLLARAAELVEDAVNKHLDASPRFPLEYKGRWRANVCGSNRYDGASSSVGWHADQLTYLGPYPTIASLSLGTPRAFRLRQTATASVDGAATGGTRTYEVPLGHNSLCLMAGGCQERWKHTVPPQKALDLFRPAWDEDMNPVPPDRQKTYTSRINITFRFYREDFLPEPGTGPYGLREGTPMCRCGIPATLRADQKAKARARLREGASRTTETGLTAGTEPSLGPEPSDDALGATSGDAGPALLTVVDDDMMFFWQCQSPGFTGEMKGCGFFRLLDMRREGRGPCIGWR